MNQSNSGAVPWLLRLFLLGLIVHSIIAFIPLVTAPADNDIMYGWVVGLFTLWIPHTLVLVIILTLVRFLTHRMDFDQKPVLRFLLWFFLFCAAFVITVYIMRLKENEWLKEVLGEYFDYYPFLFYSIVLSLFFLYKYRRLRVR